MRARGRKGKQSDVVVLLTGKGGDNEFCGGCGGRRDREEEITLKMTFSHFAILYLVF
jgi:hypothetical protein